MFRIHRLISFLFVFYLGARIVFFLAIFTKIYDEVKDVAFDLKESVQLLSFFKKKDRETSICNWHHFWHIYEFGYQSITKDVIFIYITGLFAAKVNLVRNYQDDFSKSSTKIGSFHIQHRWNASVLVMQKPGYAES